jgi:hypothetical protein
MRPVRHMNSLDVGSAGAGTRLNQKFKSTIRLSREYSQIFN